MVTRTTSMSLFAQGETLTSRRSVPFNMSQFAHFLERLLNLETHSPYRGLPRERILMLASSDFNNSVLHWN